MTRPRVLDCFMFNNELDLLECRLVELYDAVDAVVLVEAHVDHQDHPKPLWYAEHRDRYAPFKDKIVHVVAERLPTLAEDSGSWARENGQREWIGKGLENFGARPDDIILQSDVDEIPTAVAARNVRPFGNQCVSFRQRGHFWAIDWLYPHAWQGTVAARVAALDKFARAPFSSMRNTRNYPPMVPDGDDPWLWYGWHFSWLGGPDAWQRKVGSFCHPEVEDRLVNGGAERFWRDGVHVDFKAMHPVDVDHHWPRWMQDPANVPESWYRPR